MKNCCARHAASLPRAISARLSGRKKWIKDWGACWPAKRAPPAIWAGSTRPSRWPAAVTTSIPRPRPRARSAAGGAAAGREIGRWLVRAGRDKDALAPYADAFTMPDGRNTDADRAKDRAQLGDVYRKIYGSEK